ncbi:MAG: hypothetical protein HKN47_25645 [Pirellulaceae bacterium]|nr:hypothetical protein [Pirellulaceae bacterium]
MKRTTFFFLFVTMLSSQVSAISLFNKHWKDHYLANNPNRVFVTIARRAGCYVCHVKGEKKQDVRNEYGAALAEHLDADDFPKEWVKKNPDKAKQKIIAAFEKVEEELSKDKRKFGDKINNFELPAVDAGL